MFDKGAGFWLAGTGSDSKPEVAHLHCALTAPCRDGLQLIANISSIKDKVFYDPACVLQVGDHDDILVPSYVFYSKARTVNRAIIENARFGRALKLTTNFSDAVRLRIGEGLVLSEHASPKLQTYWKTNQHL